MFTPDPFCDVYGFASIHRASQIEPGPFPCGPGQLIMATEAAAIPEANLKVIRERTFADSVESKSFLQFRVLLAQTLGQQLLKAGVLFL